MKLIMPFTICQKGNSNNMKYLVICSLSKKLDRFFMATNTLKKLISFIHTIADFLFCFFSWTLYGYFFHNCMRWSHKLHSVFSSPRILKWSYISNLLFPFLPCWPFLYLQGNISFLRCFFFLFMDMDRI